MLLRSSGIFEFKVIIEFNHFRATCGLRTQMVMPNSRRRMQTVKFAIRSIHNWIGNPESVMIASQCRVGLRTSYRNVHMRLSYRKFLYGISEQPYTAVL